MNISEIMASIGKKLWIMQEDMWLEESQSLCITPDYSDKRGKGWYIEGPGVRDHFVANNPKHNDGNTLISVFALKQHIDRLFAKATA